MKLATLRDGTRDGRLLVVDRSGRRAVDAAAIAPSLQAALDDWERTEAGLRELSRALDTGRVAGTPIELDALGAPLPRAYEWIDGSAYLNHVRLVRRARGAEPPATLETDPLVYQGGSGVLLGARDSVALPDPSWGLDFEAEVCVILGDVARATPASAAARSVRLVLLANDWTYRNLVPAELAKGFGFFVSKPATAFSPFAVTPDELGPVWRDGRLHARVRSTYNGHLLGDCDAGDPMFFSFFDLVAHVTKTRALTAGTLLGSGTVSNPEPDRGVSCLAERRMIETLDTGAPKTEFMRVGDSIRIEALSAEGQSLFGAIEQKVVAA